MGMFDTFGYMGGVSMRQPRISIEITVGGMQVSVEPGWYERTDGYGDKHLDPFFKSNAEKPWMFVEAEKFISRMNKRIAEENARQDIGHAVASCGKKKVRKMVEKAKGKKRK